MCFSEKKKKKKKQCCEQLCTFFTRLQFHLTTTTRLVGWLVVYLFLTKRVMRAGKDVPRAKDPALTKTTSDVIFEKLTPIGCSDDSVV